MAEKRKRSEAADGGKSKKSKSDKSKHNKATRSRDREEPAALPEGVETGDDFTALDGDVEKPAPKATPKKEAGKAAPKEKKDKKKKAEKDTENSSAEAAAAAAEPASGDAKESKSSKKKSKKNKAGHGDAAAGGPQNGTQEGGAEGEGDKQQQQQQQQKESQLGKRFIVFVGNLPFTANEATIRQHFATVKPSGVRCLTKDGQAGTCRGFAFVEFGNPTHMRTCLDKLHHSMFNDGLSPARKINVEMTAGGGGKNDNRKEKIKAKNEKLQVNRAKKIQKELDEKKGKTGADAKQAGDDGIHPSRKAMMA